MSPNLQPTRYDLLIYNITLAIIAALLMATVGSNLRVVQLLEKTRISGLEIDLAVGVALNVGVVAGAATVAFAMAAARSSGHYQGIKWAKSACRACCPHRAAGTQIDAWSARWVRSLLTLDALVRRR